MNTVPGTFLQPVLQTWVPWLYGHSYWWTILGFFGNALFSSRFLLQWLASEKKKSLVVPSYFWHLSFWGSVLNVIYAFHIDNAPIIFGVIALPFIYGRNLVLLGRTKKPEEVVEPPKAETSETQSARPALAPSYSST
jgi:lipid-A-disaccharide synthase-like uncharacterized protein